MSNNTEEKSKHKASRKLKKVLRIRWPEVEKGVVCFPAINENFREEKFPCTKEVFDDIRETRPDRMNYANFMLYTDEGSNLVSRIEIMRTPMPGDDQIASSTSTNLLQLAVVDGDLQVISQPMDMGEVTLQSIKDAIKQAGPTSVRYGTQIGSKHKVQQVLDDEDGFRIFISPR